MPPPAPPKKKPIWKRWWFWLLAIIGLFIVIGALSGGGDDPSSAPDPQPTMEQQQPAPAPSEGQPTPEDEEAPPPAPTDPLSDGGWTASDIRAEGSQFGTSITARIVNEEDSTRSAVFTLSIFGPDGEFIGDTSGAVNDVEPGSAATVTFVGITEDLPGDPSEWTYELQNDF
jgi:hypothetical protein